MYLNTHILDKRRGAVYEVPCKKCCKTYIGETKRTYKVRLSEHKQAVKRGDPKNGIAINAQESYYGFDWDGATVNCNQLLSYRSHSA